MKRVRRRRGTRRGPLPRRLQAIAGVALLAFSALLLRAVELQTFDAERLADLAADQTQITLQIEVPRGSIRDRNGQPLAVEAPVDSVAVGSGRGRMSWPDPTALVRQLAKKRSSSNTSPFRSK